jgi:hypothetical protein
MPNRIDVVGKTFGRLVVIGNSVHRNGRRRVSCRCECGASLEVEPRQLTKERGTRSCGCLQREIVSDICKRQKTHGMTRSVEYNTWCKIKGRCENPNDKKFSDYGARGIKVSPEWSADFERFYKDMGRRPMSATSIDRIDVNGHYEPGNCRWADTLTQARNRRNHRLVEYDGAMIPLSQACELTGVNYRSALHRLNSKLPWMPTPPPPARSEG